MLSHVRFIDIHFRCFVLNSIGASTTSQSSTRKSWAQVRHFPTDDIFTILTFSVTEGRTQVERKAGLEKLRLITDHIMLRRMKHDHTSSMELPPKRSVTPQRQIQVP